MVLKKVCSNFKECSFASNDYSGFHQQKFIDDYTGVKLDLERNEDVNMMFCKFFTTVSDCVECHVPLKKMSKNCVVAENRKSKASYFKNYFATYSGNMKMLWSGTKSIINAKKISVNLISSLTDKDGNSMRSKMAEVFNDFFTNISAK